MSLHSLHCAGMVLKRETVSIHDWHSQGFPVFEASGERSQRCPQGPASGSDKFYLEKEAHILRGEVWGERMKTK